MTVQTSKHMSGDGTAGRRDAMAVLAQASSDEVENGMSGLVGGADAVELRAPESGLVMVRGRIGGDGTAFNLGEATVTRAAVRLSSGEVGFSYVLGRDHRKARFIAVCDALFQCADKRPLLERSILEPIRARLDAQRQASAERTAATRVDFFTLARGED